MPISFKLFKHPPCMSSITEGRIKPFLTRLNLQEIKNLIHTYGYMHSCRRYPFAYNMFYCVGIFLRIELLIFLLKFLRMCSRISFSAYMRLVFFHLIFPSFIFLSGFGGIRNPLSLPAHKKQMLLISIRLFYK